MLNRQPEINQWYKRRDKGQEFFVTAADENTGTIEVQDFDGAVEEYTLQEWRQADIEPCAAPESWTGALDVAEKDDLGTEITDTRRSEWDEGAQEYPVPAITEEQGDTEDDYGEGYPVEEPARRPATGSYRLDSVRERESGGYHGLIREALADGWYAEYALEPGSGLWRADVFKRDIAEWRRIDFASLEEAKQAVGDFFARV